MCEPDWNTFQEGSETIHAIEEFEEEKVDPIVEETKEEENWADFGEVEDLEDRTQNQKQMESDTDKSDDDSDEMEEP